VDLGSIAVPAPFSRSDWLKVYPSYGFLLVCDVSARDDSLELFHQRGIWAAEIGRTDASQRLCLRLEKEEAVLFDFSRKGIF
jgi:selenophosphate synthetase-related protein